MQYQHHFGKKFYLDNKTGYWISTTCPKIRAHVWVWKSHFGKVPQGHHIHHIDEDKSNNVIENLILMTKFEHLSLHASKPENIKRSSALCNAIRYMTKEWHGSEEGLKWHSQHAKETFKRKNPVNFSCACCQEMFVADSMDAHHSKFCSNKCKSKWRRDLGIDDIDDVCEKCHQTFRRNKYAKTRFCSRTCCQNRHKN